MSNDNVLVLDPEPDEHLTARQKWRLVGLVILKRLRFFLILAAVGLFIGYWDTILNYWDKWTRPSSASTRQLEAGQEFFCPMHPQVVRATYEPNGDVPKCPICGMPLSVRKKGETVPLPIGVTGRVQLTPERVQAAGIKVVPVERRAMARQIMTVGYVTFDESRLSRVVSRVSGYVEKLYVDKTFMAVAKGDPLADIYSPELYSTAREMARSAREPGGEALVESSRRRLKLLGVSDNEIDDILTRGTARPRLVLRSPQSGRVMRKNIVEGTRVEDGMALLEIADLSTVWIEADVYEKDIALLQPGMSVEARVEAIPNRTFRGRLALIYPQLDASTRTNRVRLELDNPGQELRPGMYATVELRATPEDSLAVPESAVVQRGDENVVWVEREPGLFEGMKVVLGPRDGEYFPVVKGLKPGDKIAAAGGFLIDAEAHLNPAAASTYFGASGGPQAGGRPAATGATKDSGSTKDTKEHEGGEAAAATTEKKAEPAAALPEISEDDRKNVEKLPEGERQAALAQGYCPITRQPLGSMGVPVKITLRGQTVYLCCEGCRTKAKHAPDETLKIVEELKKAKR